MNFNTQTNTDTTPFQNLDGISALKEIPDGAAATCSGGVLLPITLYDAGNLQGSNDDNNPNNDFRYFQIGGSKVGDNINLKDLKRGNGVGFDNKTSSVSIKQGTWLLSTDENGGGKRIEIGVGDFTQGYFKGKGIPDNSLSYIKRIA